MFLALLILWLIFAGSLTVTNLVSGILVSGLLTLLCTKFLGYGTGRFLRSLRKVGPFLGYLLFLLKEIFVSNLAVLGLIYRKKEPEPRLVRFRSGLKSEGANVLVANSITLTPGTFTVALEGDDFTVHALDRSLAEGIEKNAFIQKARRLEE